MSKPLNKLYTSLWDKVIAKTKKLDFDRKYISISDCISKAWTFINNILKPINNNKKKAKLKNDNSKVFFNKVADIFIN